MQHLWCPLTCSSEFTDTTRYPRLILYIYCLISRISHFSKEPSFFLLYVDKHFFSEQRETKFFLPQLHVLFFSFLILLARTSSTVLNRRPQRRYPCLFPDHRWQALRKLPYIPSLLRPFFFFYHASVLDFIKYFLCINWYDNMIFFLLLIDVINFINWSFNVKPDLCTWNKSHLVMVYSYFYTCWILFAYILLKIIRSMFMRVMGL